MSEGNSIQGSFGVSLAPLKSDMAQAPGIARSGAQQVTLALKTELAKGEAAARTSSVNWAKLARERETFLAPVMRGRTAADFRPARPGQYTKPEEEEEDGARGGTLPRGFGRALTLVAGVTELVNLYKSLNDEQRGMNEKAATFTRLTGSSEFRGVSELQENLKGSSELLEEIGNRTRIETRQASGSFSDVLARSVRSGRQLLTGDSDEQEHLRAASLRAQASRDISALAQKQQALNDAADEELSGDERKGALLKEQIRYREKLGALAAAEARAGVDNPAARQAANRENVINNLGIHKRFDERDAELRSNFRLADLRRSGAPATLQEHAGTLEKLGLLNRRLQTQPLTNQQRTETATEVANTEAANNQQLLAQSRRPYAERAQEIRDAQKDQRDLKRLQANKGLMDVHRDTSGSVISGIDPFTLKRQNVDAPDPFAALNQRMQLPGPMGIYGGSDEFNKAFGGPSAGASGADADDDDGADLDDVVDSIDALKDLISKWD